MMEINRSEARKQKDRNQKLNDDLIKRLARIEGQIRGIQRMIQGDLPCDEILNQIIAVQSALRAVSTRLLDNRIKSCIMESINTGDLDTVDELIGTIKRIMK
jgi:DNA-binding FrmR family transcriptional regulator